MKLAGEFFMQAQSALLAGEDLAAAGRWIAYQYHLAQWQAELEASSKAGDRLQGREQVFDLDTAIEAILGVQRNGLGEEIRASLVVALGEEETRRFENAIRTIPAESLSEVAGKLVAYDPAKYLDLTIDRVKGLKELAREEWPPNWFNGAITSHSALSADPVGAAKHAWFMVDFDAVFSNIESFDFRLNETVLPTYVRFIKATSHTRVMIGFDPRAVADILQDGRGGISVVGRGADGTIAGAYRVVSVD